jgi:hypothetical protein
VANPLFHYGAPVISFGCIALLVGRAVAYGCGGDAGAIGEPTVLPPNSSNAVVEPSAALPSASAALPSASAALPSASAALSVEHLNVEEWGGMSKSGRMLTPRPRPSTKNAPSSK